jgi:hypothetical protein
MPNYRIADGFLYETQEDGSELFFSRSEIDFEISNCDRLVELGQPGQVEIKMLWQERKIKADQLGL